jgi:hypothetical protein
MLADVDPDGRDPALRQMVLIGHSQGGLLARLIVTDSGDPFWNNIAKEPLAGLKMKEETRELVKSSMFFEPLPFVKQIIFLCTPHRGSFRVTGLVLDVIRRLVTLPARVVKGMPEVAEENPGLLATAMRAPTAVDNMLPGQQFIRTLSASPMAPWVTTHSIIAVRGIGPPEGLSEGGGEVRERAPGGSGLRESGALRALGAGQAGDDRGGAPDYPRGGHRQVERRVFWLAPR